MVSAFEFTGKASFNRWRSRGRWWMWSEFYVLSLIDSSSLASSSHSVINLITLTRFVLDGPRVIILNHQILDLSPVPILLLQRRHLKKNRRSVILSRQAINSSIWPPHYPVSINGSLNKSRKSQSGVTRVPKLIYRTNVYRPPTTTRTVSQVNTYCGFIRWAIGNYCQPALGSDGAAQ